MRNFTKNGERIKHITEIRKIKEQYCTVVVTESIKDAEEICLKHNNEKLNSVNKLKVHIHPYSCFLRRNKLQTDNEYFTQINQSMTMIKDSIKKSETEALTVKAKDEKKATKLPIELKQTLISYFDEIEKKFDIDSTRSTLNSSHKIKVRENSHRDNAAKLMQGKDFLNQSTEYMQDIKESSSHRQNRRHSSHRDEEKYLHRPQRDCICGHGSIIVKEYRPAKCNDYETFFYNEREGPYRRREDSMHDGRGQEHNTQTTIQKVQGLEEGEIILKGNGRAVKSPKQSRDNSYDRAIYPLYRREIHEHSKRHLYCEDYYKSSYSKHASRDENWHGERRTRNYYPSGMDYSR
eukprot:TRINITY_DN3671_c0_g1_i3.p1 TRINITY_DN3671_c0_g1~~TRINITY_DN3671_c0_g1_i3.p1  ORF type:complete len:349 (-),score=63.82 TRINITY_DN3671_c0_g1_i3:133-1179(-)